MRSAAALFALTFAVTSIAAPVAPSRVSQQGKPFWTTLGAGPYPVGFRVIYRRGARPWGGESGRPLRISLWYPSVAGTGRPMAYGDYLHHHSDPGFESVDARLDAADIDSWKADLRDIAPKDADQLFARLMNTPVAAHLGADRAAGTFPLLLYSGGKASRADANVELGEYLASHGYVVAVLPQLGPSPSQIDLGSSPADITLHADDYAAALEALRSLGGIDFTAIAAAGHSAGGEVALELAFRDSAIRAVIGLDGSYGMGGGVRTLQQLPGYQRGRVVGAALLDVRRGTGAQGAVVDRSAVEAVHWRKFIPMTFGRAFHGDFTEWGMVAYVLDIPMPTNPDHHTRKIGFDVNRVACRAVLDFLDAELRGDAAARKRLQRLVKEPK